MAIGVTFLLICIVYSVSALVKLQEIFSWNVLDWSYPDEYSRQLAIQVESLIPENAIPVGIEKWKNKLFVTVPRWVGGVPATLNYITLDTPYDPSPKLLPYPSYEGNELGNCNNGLTTVYRIKADICDRLWVLDVGTFGYGPNITRICPHTLYVYDLNSDQRVRKYIFKKEDLSASTLITNIALDIGSSCLDTYAYFSDQLGYGLIVYSWEKNKSWRFTHSYFMPDPLVGNYNISGLVFHWGNEGIYSLALSPIIEDGYRTLYFSPLSSHTEFSVSTRVLRDESKVKKCFEDFKIVGFRGPDGHTAAKVMDGSGVQLFSLVDKNAIACWSSFVPYKTDKIIIVDRDDMNLIFSSDIKIDEDKLVWIISNRMPLFIESVLDYSDINFRIFSAPLNTLIEGTSCEPPTQVMSNLLLTRSNIKPFSYRKPKNLPVSFTTPKLQIPAGINKPQFYNTSNIFNFSIIVRSNVVNYEKSHYKTQSKNYLNKETTPKMIIYVNSPDFNEITANNFTQYSNDQQINKKTSIVKKIKTKSRNTTIVPVSYIYNNDIRSFNNMDSPSLNHTVFFLKNINSSNKTPKISNNKNKARFTNSKQTVKSNFSPKNYINESITKHKNNAFANNKTSFSYKAIVVANDITTPLYDDEDYQTDLIINVAPTKTDFRNELWYTGSTSEHNPDWNNDQEIIEDTNSNTEPPPVVVHNAIPNTVINKDKKHISNLTNNKHNTIKKAKHGIQARYPNRREKHNKNKNYENAIINYVSSPTSFPKRVNFINAAYVNDETLKHFDYKSYRPAPSISKIITNTNVYSNQHPKKNGNVKRKSNINVKVNVLYPATVRAKALYPK